MPRAKSREVLFTDAKTKRESAFYENIKATQEKEDTESGKR